MLTFTGSSMKGPWGAAQIGIHKALARSGVVSDFKSYDGEAESLPAHHRGEVDIGVNFREQVMFAYRGIGAYAKEPLPNLRGLATLIQPQYVGIAATWESGITSLDQVAAEKRPIRLFTVARSSQGTRTMGLITSRVLELSGFTQADVVSWGGKLIVGQDPGFNAIVAGDVDLIVIPAYSSYTPSWGYCWMEAQVRLNLRFLGIPQPIRDALTQELDLRQGELPAGLFRGVEHEVPTFVAQHHTVVSHAALRDEDAYTIVRAIDEHPECLQEQQVPFAFHPRAAWEELGIPLHPGAEAYYRERGYLTTPLPMGGAGEVPKARVG
jgi:uncharacterized protein